MQGVKASAAVPRRRDKYGAATSDGHPARKSANGGAAVSALTAAQRRAVRGRGALLETFTPSKAFTPREASLSPKQPRPGLFRTAVP